jgi:hypothetical protein
MICAPSSIDDSAHAAPVGSRIALCLGLLAFDYARCFLVVGWPAIAWTTHRIREMALEMLWLTLWSQLAERISAWVAGLFAAPAAPLRGLPGEPGFREDPFVIHFVIGGVLVGILIWYFARRRWGLSNGAAWTLTLASGFLTNPVFGGYASAAW